MNVKFDDGINVIYKIILEKAIDDITNKIGEKIDGITWIIFNEESYEKKNKEGYFGINIPSFLFPINYKYGFCYCKKKEIWISTAAIRSYDLRQIKLPILFVKKKKSNLLVNVILDELAHIKTQKNHGNKKYDDLLEKYHILYYK